MYITFEISRPVQLKPWLFRSQVTLRFGWLCFAVGYHPMREDEMHSAIEKGKVAWAMQSESSKHND